MKAKFIYFLILLISSNALADDFGGKSNRPKNVYVFSIGINNYGSLEFNNCVNDAQSVIKKIQFDRETYRSKMDHVKNLYEVEKDTLQARKFYENEIRHLPRINLIKSYLLIEQEATLESIRNTFKRILREEKIEKEDYFIFSFAGFADQSTSGETFLLPHGTDPSDLDSHPEKLFSLKELAGFLEQITSDNQLIISDAGGPSFATNLVANLIETNPQISTSLDRDRIILTTNGIGYDVLECKGKNIYNGPLTYYLTQSSAFLLSVFEHRKVFEFELYKMELECPATYLDYTSIISEKEFRNIYLFFLKSNEENDKKSRGSTPTLVGGKSEPKTDERGKNYALLIATNKYNKDQSSWSDLKNPVNDARVIGEILKSKFNADVKTLFNPNKDTALKSIASLKGQLGVNDKLIFFIAGHGYYDPTLSDGFLAFKDSQTLEDDYGKSSYLQMAMLNRMLDGVNSKQVFAIFDVCFGASFDPLSQDLVLSNYDNEMDVSLEKFFERKNEKFSRIFLASGPGEVPDFWSNSLDHSPFATKVIRALKEEKEFISPGKIYSYLQGNATEPVLKKFGSHEERGDFLLPVVAN